MEDKCKARSLEELEPRKGLLMIGLCAHENCLRKKLCSGKLKRALDERLELHKNLYISPHMTILIEYPSLVSFTTHVTGSNAQKTTRERTYCAPHEMLIKSSQALIKVAYRELRSREE